MPDLLIGGYFTAWWLDEEGYLHSERLKNGINNGALNDILAVYLGAGTQKPTWYFGLIDNAGFSALSVNDTIASHAGWTENQAYAEAVRQTWTPGAVAGQAIANPTPATFTINAPAVIQGLFLASNNVKGGTTGQLWATGLFGSGPQTLISGQPLKVTYSLSAAGN
jgi:hypothetical protein